MSIPLLSSEALCRALHLRDLSDPLAGPHAMQRLVADLTSALADRWGCAVQIHRPGPVVPVADNYDRLGYPPGGRARDARYTRYVTPEVILRTQTSAAIPGLLRALAPTPPADLLLAVPGLVYRRDAIDRLHTGEPHQIDLWRVRQGTLCGEVDLIDMIEVALGAVLPGLLWRTEPRAHPYTLQGRQIDVSVGGEWIEVGECGLADPALLARCGLAGTSGLAMGLGLDRLLMLRKGIPDIRLLRDPDPRVAEQMLNLTPYRPTSSQPATRRDLSLVLPSGEDNVEILGDRVREALGDEADCIESVEVLSRTARGDLPEGARQRLGLLPGQLNVLLRIVIRHPSRTLTAREAGQIRNRVYSALHAGPHRELEPE